MAALVCKTLLRRPKTSDKTYLNDLPGVNWCNGTDKWLMKKKMKALLCLILPDVRRELLCMKVCTIRHFITLTTAVWRHRRLVSTRGMIMAGENLNTVSTTNLTRSDSESNLGLRGDRPATYGLSHSTANCLYRSVRESICRHAWKVWRITTTILPPWITYLRVCKIALH